MPNICPVSDLRNYTAVLDSVNDGSPVYLTKNGRGCYAIISIREQEEQQRKAEEYDRMKAQLRLLCELNAGRRSGEENGWIPSEKVRELFCNLENEE